MVRMPPPRVRRSGRWIRRRVGVSERTHRFPISAWCAVDTNGRLLPNELNELRVSASRSRCRNFVGLNPLGIELPLEAYGIFEVEGCKSGARMALATGLDFRVSDVAGRGGGTAPAHWEGFHRREVAALSTRQRPWS